MGVDIFLNSIWEPFEAKYEPKIDSSDPEESMNCAYDDMRASGGYFRNGYNCGDIMWAMGLSWSDVRLMLDSKFFLPIARASELLDMVEAHPLTREKVEAHVSEHIMTNDTKGRDMQQMLQDMIGKTQKKEPPDLDYLFAFLNTRRDQLLEILRKSIELNEPLECSI
jgi:hypothetical protein